tara:strand:+ start:81 stop:689 length:609 start_codon:yes stop_codon:yes gene_type:complete
MEITNEHNGVKFGEKCWAWDNDESGGEIFTFTAYLKGTGYPVKVFDDHGHADEFRHARPIKTETEKVLEAFEGHKICMGEGISRYIIPQSIDHRGRLQCLRDDGATIYLDGVHFDDWQLWEAPKVTLDTRRVAGMWCACPHMTDKARLVECVDIQKGLNLRLTGSNDLDGSDLKDDYVFSKDPMKPLDEWQNLAEICEEAQA